MTNKRFAAKELLNSGQVAVLDGASGTELEARGLKLHPKLWSAIAMLPENESQLASLYQSYFDAGANIITTPTYQASKDGFNGLIDGENYGKLLEKIVRDARTIASEQKGSEPHLVAASVGPIGAIKCGGQEYTGDYNGITSAEIYEYQHVQISNLLAGGPDILLVETVPNITEVESLCKVLENLKVQVPVWLSFSVSLNENGVPTLADGTMFDEVVEVLTPRIEVVGANCFDPKLGVKVLEQLKQFKRPLLLYPNLGKVYDPVSKDWTGGSGDSWDLEGWLRNGVQVFGGCCQVGPSEIRDISAYCAAKNQQLNS